MAYGYATFVVKNDDTVWACGKNDVGQLGLGSKVDKYSLTKINMSDVKQIDASYGFTYLLKNDGTLYSTGENGYGELGIGNATEKLVFTKINIENVKQISCGHEHAFVLKNDGTVWGTGQNTKGQLGLGNNIDKKTFTKADITDVESVDCGAYHTAILKKDGTVWVTGHNYQGQLGFGTSGDGTDKNIFTKIDIKDAKGVACGTGWTMVWKKNGTLYSSGDNSYGQLGLGDKVNRDVFTKVDIENVESLISGYTHVIVLNKRGELYACGRNTYGQLALGHSDEVTTFSKINIENIRMVGCQRYHTMFVTDDNELFSVGINTGGCIGDGTTTTVPNLKKINIDDVKFVSNYMNIDIKKFIVSDSGKYYSIENSTLVEIQDEITMNTISEQGVTLDEINNNMSILPKEFCLLTNSEMNISVKGLKENSQMLVANNDFHAIIQENIDYFKCESEKVGNGQIKLVFSIDGGTIWKSYDGTNFVDLSIEIPMKEFELLSSDELDKWNNSKEEILVNGIDVDVLETLDFNTLGFDKIRFAYAIDVDTSDDVAVNKKLIWQFDSKGSMQKLKDSEYDLKLHSNGVEFKSLIDTDMVKVNILPNGIAVGGDTDFATDSDIDDMFS